MSIKTQMDSRQKEIKQVRNKQDREAQLKALKKNRDELEALTKSAASIDTLEQWLLDGMKNWIDSFLPGIVNLRIYPSVSRPSEHVFGHLKKECFEDVDTDSFHFTYGSFPSEELTVLGIVTAVPSEENDQFDPLGEFQSRRLDDHEAVESGFRGLFAGFHGMEEIIRTCRFPRVLVYPLTVYRSTSANK